jgi:hypothetical protein
MTGGGTGSAVILEAEGLGRGENEMGERGEVNVFRSDS